MAGKFRMWPARTAVRVRNSRLLVGGCAVGAEFEVEGVYISVGEGQSQGIPLCSAEWQGSSLWSSASVVGVVVGSSKALEVASSGCSTLRVFDFGSCTISPVSKAAIS